MGFLLTFSCMHVIMYCLLLTFPITPHTHGDFEIRCPPKKQCRGTGGSVNRLFSHTWCSAVCPKQPDSSFHRCLWFYLFIFLNPPFGQLRLWYYKAGSGKYHFILLVSVHSSTFFFKVKCSKIASAGQSIAWKGSKGLCDGMRGCREGGKWQLHVKQVDGNGSMRRTEHGTGKKFKALDH